MFNLFKPFRRRIETRNLDLTVAELEEISLGRANREGARPLELTVSEDRFRYVPKTLVETSKRHLQETSDIEKILRYIKNAFYIYRETANECFVAPHYLNEDAFEWPKPSKFDWSDIDIVITVGEVFNGNIPKKDSKVRVETIEGNQLISTEIDPFVKERTTKIKEIIPGINTPQRIFRYHIPELKYVGFLGSFEWQNESLSFYANPVYWLLNDFLEGKLKPEEAKKYLDDILSRLSESYPASIERYTRYR